MRYSLAYKHSAKIKPIWYWTILIHAHKNIFRSDRTFKVRLFFVNLTRNTMQNSTLYPTVYVLGNGQLGRMLGYAGTPLDIYVEPLAFNAPVFDLPENAIITAEIERWEKRL